MNGPTDPTPRRKRKQAVAFAALAIVALQAACGATDEGRGPGPTADAGIDAGSDAGIDAGPDAGVDAGPDAGIDAGPDAGIDAGPDAGIDAGPDAGIDAGPDAGPACLPGTGNSTSATIDGDGGSLAFEAVTLTFPPGAVPFATTIGIRSSTGCPDDDPSLDAVSPLYDFSPPGLHFAVPVQVALAVSGGSGGGSPLLRWTRPGGGWEADETASDGAAVSGPVTHFSGGYAAKVHSVQSASTFRAVPDVIEDGLPSLLLVIMDGLGILTSESCTVDQGVGTLVADDVGASSRRVFRAQVSPAATTTYTATCVGDVSFTQSATVQVRQSPLATLDAQPREILLGGSTTLTYTFATHLIAALAANGIELTVVSANGTQDESPIVNTTYSLTTANGGPRFLGRSVEVTVRACNTTLSDLNGGSANAARGATTSVGTAGSCGGGQTITGAKASGFPAGVTAATTGSQLAPGPPGISVTVAPSVATGTYVGAIDIYSSDGNLQSVPLSLTIGDPAIALAIAPASIGVSPGTTAAATATVTRYFGAACDSTVHATDLPSGVTAADVAIPAANANNYPYNTGTVTLVADPGAPLTGTPAQATLTATCGALTAQTHLGVAVQQPPPGTLDPGFGSAGVVTSLLGGATSEQINDLGVDLDANIVVVGTITISGTRTAFIARYSPEGGLDSTFNAGGANGGNGFATWSWGGSNPSGNALILGPGTSYTVIGSGGDMGVARFTSAGVLDTNFGNHDGLRTGGINFGGAFAGFLQPDGKVVAAGIGTYGGKNVVTAARFLADGTGLDTTFGAGTGPSKYGYQYLQTATGLSNSRALGAGLAPGGKIVLAGYDGSPPTTGHVLLVGLAADGSFDPTFGTNGISELTFHSEAIAYSMVMQPSGVLVAGQTEGTFGEAFLEARADLTGALDTTFGTTGSIDSVFPANGQFTASEAHAIRLDGSGRIVTTGFAYAGHSRQNLAVARRSATSGALDGTFDGSSGGAGLVAVPISAYPDQGNAIAFQADGKIVIAGQSATSGSAYTSFIVRLLP